ncbi:MAG: extracellular solute-binding protein [Lachnospiraceae bacterium]|nr:extracellular solute-binding protein [Lachnospiraceae bacterium]
MKLKKILCLSLSLCMALALPGCGSSEETTGSDDKKADTTTEAATEDDKAATDDTAKKDDKATGGDSVSIAWAESDSTQVEVMEKYVKPALEEAFPDINFDYTGITTDKAEALKTMSATGELPDIFCSDSGIYETLLTAGDFLDLAPGLEKDDWLKTNYTNPQLLYSGDTLYNVTVGQNDYYTPVIYFNKDMFEKYNIAEPTTMDEFVSACQTLVDNGVYPITTSTTFASYFMMDALIASYDPEALNDLHSRKVDWTDERIVAALKVFDQLKEMGAFAPDSATKGDSDCLAEFANGTAAMWPTMSWYNGEVTTDKVDFTADTFNWPSGNDKYPTGSVQLNWGSVYGGWAVNAHAKNTDTCIDVLKVILKAEAQRHADNGLSENFIVEGAKEPTNPLEIKRMEAYKNADTYRTLLFITAMDAATNSEFTTNLSMLVSDDDSYLSQNFIDDFNKAWALNTKAAD